MKTTNYTDAHNVASELLKENFSSLNISENIIPELVFGGIENDDEFFFELYVPDETPSEAKVLATITINKITGKKSFKVICDKANNCRE